MLPTLLLAAAALTAPQDVIRGPSFDCTAAFAAVEQAICSDAQLAALDVQLGERYAAVRRALPAGARAALRDDQRWFLGARDEWFGNRDHPGFSEFPDLAERMAGRIEFLESVRTEPADRLTGVWSNLAGEVLVMPADGGRWRVEVTAAHPVNARWICEVGGAGRIVDGVLTVVADEASEWRIQARLRRGFLELVETGPGAAADRPYCGHNGFVAGAYFRSR